ncbi:hypothetical protein Tco_0047836 [Tanacetum coccineum]
MTTLKFADTHNLVAFFEKPTKSEGFKQIVDFLNASHIMYALTFNPIIYASCIHQFWATTKVKSINEEVQLQALVDGKKVIITEMSVRKDLQLEDVEGIECLPNDAIFEQFALIGEKGFSGRVTPLFPTMMVQAQEEMGKADENVPTHSNDPLLSGEDRLKLNELMELCVVKKLEKKEVKKLTGSEDYTRRIASKQGRKIDEINQDAEVTLVDETQGRYGDNLMFDNGVLDNEEVFVEHDMAEKEVDIDEKNVSSADQLLLLVKCLRMLMSVVISARLNEATLPMN